MEQDGSVSLLLTALNWLNRPDLRRTASALLQVIAKSLVSGLWIVR
uniref:Uncharacterized protein n=1 Tax=uncultured bacterium esnapd15 TaxID=1366595 RepID=S5TUZ3_9BACT|nr:hypothetical protein [uncultured bacterium esnapd15]